MGRAVFNAGIALTFILIWASAEIRAQDHPLIKSYPGSSIAKRQVLEFQEYELPLGPVANGKFQKSEHLEGKLTALEYYLPANRSVLEVMRNYQDALQQAGFRTLFSCVRRECGTAIHTPYLGTLDGYNTDERRDYRFVAAKLTRDEGDVYVALLVRAVGVPCALPNVVEVKPVETGLVKIDAGEMRGGIDREGHVALYGIYFDTDKTDLKPESEPVLEEIAKLLETNPSLNLHVVGHTDNVGDLAHNMDLSRRRAAAVVQALVARHSIAASRLHPDGVGPLAPVASNKTDQGRARNRRVELVEQ